MLLSISMRRRNWLGLYKLEIKQTVLQNPFNLYCIPKSKEDKQLVIIYLPGGVFSRSYSTIASPHRGIAADDFGAKQPRVHPKDTYLASNRFEEHEKPQQHHHIVFRSHRNTITLFIASVYQGKRSEATVCNIENIITQSEWRYSYGGGKRIEVFPCICNDPRFWKY